MSDDCISRQAVLDFFKDDVYVCNEVMNMAPVTPKPKTGKWIYKPMKGIFCSECDEPSVWKFNYCPNCGARMESEE